MTDDASRVQELLDRQDIHNCIARLARGMDRHDADLMASAYHPEAYEDHGTFRGPAADFIVHVNGTDTDVGSHARQFVAHHHLLLNHVVDLDGDEAHAETYFLFVAELRASPVVKLTGGRYLDHLVRQGEQWVVLARRTVIEWATEVPATGTTRSTLMPLFAGATWDRSDVSYQRPLRVRQPGVE
jgi:hypothetical protein